MKYLNTLSTYTRSIRGFLCDIPVRLPFFLLAIALTLSAGAQDRAALEKKRETILEEIRYTERLLTKARKDVEATSADLSAVRRKIELREALIGNLEGEVRALNREVRQYEREVEELNVQLEKLKEHYARAVYQSYKYQKSSQQLLFVLGAENVNQAVRRLNYVRKINQRRKEQADEINQTAGRILERIASLEATRESKRLVLAENRIQMQSLEDERRMKDRYIARLKKNESKYREQISKKDDEAKKLDKEIRLIIERELAARADKTEEFGSTPEALMQLSRDFQANKGKLPWPVEKGYVTRYFGKQNHPELKNITIDNNGIDIRTAKNSPVRAVFNGEVVSVFTNPMFKHAVIVKHGDYFTVYTKLGNVKVRKGDQLSTKDVIGHVFTDNDVAEVHLEVWKGKTNLDPYTWIVRK